MFLKRRLQLAAEMVSASVRTFRIFLTCALLMTGPQADLLGRVHRDRERQVAVDDPQHEVLALLAEEFLVPQLFDDGRPVLRMDDGVSLTERGQVFSLRESVRPAGAWPGDDRE